MPSLVIPESGLSLGSSRNALSSKPGSIQDVFGLTLNDSVIEEMIRCVQNGKHIQLSLGEHPSLQYGSKVQHLSTSDDQFIHELYQTSDSDSESQNSTTSSIPSNKTKGMKVNSKPRGQFLAMFAPKSFIPSNKSPTNSTAKSSSMSTNIASATAGTDAALAALQNSLASENQKKRENTTNYIKDGSGLPAPGRRGGSASKVNNKSKFLSQNRSLGNDTARSMPSSPALSGIGSPSLGPTSVPLSQQQAEQAKATRKPVVHLLALKPMKEEALRESIPNASNNDIKQALLKVADENEGKWELRKLFWKELDVWTYKYDSVEDRQRAIDNAVKQYDKMRLGASEPQWDRLLPKSERGTGKCLSKLQAQIAQGPVARAPKINVHGTEDSGRDTPARKDEEEDLHGDKNLSKLKGSESMTRSVSQPPTTKQKKISDKEAQAKRLLSKNPKPAPKPAIARKEKPKPSGKFLSSQFVSDSDEEEDNYLANPKTAPQSAKRSREDDGETSDSSIPLSKKVKKESHNQRISDSSQTSRTTNASTSSSSSRKNKGNSPQKSSPLASSPPTNASEFENSSGGRTSSSASPAHSTIKISRSPIHKRHQKSSSVTSSSSSGSQRSLKPEVMDTARKYRSYYPKYLALHKEVAALRERRDTEKEERLLEMHNRLAKMKKDILEGIIDST